MHSSTLGVRKGGEGMQSSTSGAFRDGGLEVGMLLKVSVRISTADGTVHSQIAW